MHVPSPPARPSKALYWSLVVTTALAVLLVSGSFWLASHAENEQAAVVHTMAVRNQLSQVLILVQRTETSQRGYLLTGRDVYLGPYERAAADLPAAIDETERLVRNNPSQAEAVAALRKLVEEKLEELGKTIEARKADQNEAALALVNSDRGLRLMGAVHARIAAMEAEENRLLQARRETATALASLLKAGDVLVLLLIVAVGVLVIRFTQRSFAALTTAHDLLKLSNQELLDQISQREQAESQLRQSHKMRAIGQLTGGIAHDFNNMLGVIAGSLDLVRRRLAKGNLDVARFLDAASRASERAATLTHRLLAFARQQPLAPEPLDANKMIAQMSDLLRSTLGEQIRIESVCAGGLWMIHTDANQLESAILNVAINARDAMPQGGKLTIETANAYLDEAYCRQHLDVEPGQYVLIAITDTGSGMAPEVAAQAFDPFFTTKPTGKGTGLGLSQVYGFVKQSHGHVKIYSEPGAGTTVKVYLPRQVAAAERLAERRPQPPETGHPNEVILVVEDDPLMREISVDALRDLGYTVFDSDNGAGALRLLEATPTVTLLFTDVVMPDMNGKKLADEALRLQPELKVLFTTGYTSNAVVHGGVLDPGVNFLSKPFSIEQLASKVRAVLDGRRKPVRLPAE
jgi:signal transduction histidine kinase/CheY-like chemotaxis protein